MPKVIPTRKDTLIEITITKGDEAPRTARFLIDTWAEGRMESELRYAMPALPVAGPLFDPRWNGRADVRLNMKNARLLDAHG